jgi:hypothetical protein
MSDRAALSRGREILAKANHDSELATSDQSWQFATVLEFSVMPPCRDVLTKMADSFPLPP